MATGGEEKFIAADALGIWIMLNTIGQMPETEEEYELARTAGAGITSAFFNWWSAPC